MFDIVSQTINNSWKIQSKSSPHFMIIKITFPNPLLVVTSFVNQLERYTTVYNLHLLNLFKQIENEENVLVCLRIIIELHKQFRPPLQSEVIIITVPCKSKLTVSTRNSILDPRSYRVLRIEFRVSRIETLEEIFRGSQ